MLFSYDIFSCACLSSQSHCISRMGFLSISITGHVSGVIVCTGPLTAVTSNCLNQEPWTRGWLNSWTCLEVRVRTLAFTRPKSCDCMCHHCCSRCASHIPIVQRHLAGLKQTLLGRVSQTVCSLPMLLGFPICLVGALLLTPAAPDPDTAPLASCPLTWHTYARATLAGYAPRTATTAGLTLTKR